MNPVPVFTEFAKIARLSRNCTVTEKIDGTNASIFIADDSEPFAYEDGTTVPFLVGSRNRWLTLAADNFGFARWAYANAADLLKLGPGQHFGEWWGAGIQRGYGLAKGEKRFSLFNTARWRPALEAGTLSACVSLVPVLFEGIFSSTVVDEALSRLREQGSVAAPGFMDPEGVVIYQTAGRMYWKKTLKGDEVPKALAALGKEN